MTAGFFPPRWVPDREPEPDPRGWLADVDGRIEIPEDGGRRIAQDLGAVDTDRARIALSWVDVHPHLVAFEVRSELLDVRGGEALQGFLDATMEEHDGAAPPSSGLSVGVELDDGSRLRTYPTGPSTGGALRLERRSGGASAERDRSSRLRETFLLTRVPAAPFRIVVAFPAVGVTEVAVEVDASAGS